MLLLFAHFYGVSQRQSLNSRLQIRKSKAAKGCPDMYMYLQFRLSSGLLAWLQNLRLYLYHWIYLHLSAHSDVSI